MILDNDSVRQPNLSTDPVILVVDGRYVASGDLAAMRKLFDCEIDKHRAQVELRMLEVQTVKKLNGKSDTLKTYKTILRRNKLTPQRIDPTSGPLIS